MNGVSLRGCLEGKVVVLVMTEGGHMAPYEGEVGYLKDTWTDSQVQGMKVLTGP